MKKRVVDDLLWKLQMFADGGDDDAGGADDGANLQATIANVWAKLEEYYVDKDVTPVYFISTGDVAVYLGTASITVQTAFGFSKVTIIRQ